MRNLWLYLLGVSIEFTFMILMGLDGWRQDDLRIIFVIIGAVMAYFAISPKEISYPRFEEWLDWEKSRKKRFYLPE